MAESAVVKEQLTDAMVEAGAELTKKLDEMGLQVTSALWLFMPELNEWRLLFASPEVSARGPRDVYERVRQAINQLGERAPAVPLAVIGVLDPNDDVVRFFKGAIQIVGGRWIRLSKNVINGQFIDDALIYRVG